MVLEEGWGKEEASCVNGINLLGLYYGSLKE